MELGAKLGEVEGDALGEEVDGAKVGTFVGVNVGVTVGIDDGNISNSLTLVRNKFNIYTLHSSLSIISVSEYILIIGWK